MNKILKEKLMESLSSVLPITVIVLLLSVTVAPMPVGTLTLFLTGAVLLIIGMAFFSLGTDVSMTPMGEGIEKSGDCYRYYAADWYFDHDCRAGPAGFGGAGTIHP